MVDMNLSPEWAPLLVAGGHDAVHWRDVGSGRAPDDEIMAWATQEDRVILTADHDFAAALALGGLSSPSVVQLRMGSTDPRVMGAVVIGCIAAVQDDLHGGAILTVDTGRARLRRGPGQTNSASE